VDSRDDNACRALLAAVVANGVAEDDHAFVMSKTFKSYCDLIGLSEEVQFELVQRYLRNELNPRRFLPVSMAAGRREQAPESPVFWDSWGRLPR